MGDPMNDRLPPNDNLLNRRRRKDLARIVGPRTLDGENVCTRCGVPDVHCQCDDRIDYDAQVNHVTVRNALQKLSWRLANEKPPDDKEGSTGTG